MEDKGWNETDAVRPTVSRSAINTNINSYLAAAIAELVPSGDWYCCWCCSTWCCDWTAPDCVFGFIDCIAADNLDTADTPLITPFSLLSISPNDFKPPITTQSHAQTPNKPFYHGNTFSGSPQRTASLTRIGNSGTTWAAISGVFSGAQGRNWWEKFDVLVSENMTWCYLL